MNLAQPISVRLEVEGLVCLLRQGYLSGSWMAATLADPFAYGNFDHAPARPRFIFSDIPDLQFREPCDILEMSEVEGGNKS